MVSKVVFALVLFVPSLACAGPTDTIAQKNGWIEYERSLDAKIVAVNKTCGAKLTGNYDKSTYPSFDPLQDRTQSACQQAVDVLSVICATPAGKQAISGLRAVSCRFSTGGTGVKASSGTLLIDIDPAKSSIVGLQPGSYSWKSAIEEIL